MVILEACEGWDWEEAGAEHPAEAHGVVSHLGGTRRVTTAPPHQKWIPQEPVRLKVQALNGGALRGTAMCPQQSLVNFAKGFLFGAFFCFLGS